MEPPDDKKLSEILKEWHLPGARASLDTRVLGRRKPWWSFLFTGSVRIPKPVALAIVAALAVMAVALLSRRPAPPKPPSTSIDLADFHPAKDLNYRVIRREE